MRMGHDHKVDFGSRDRKVHILILDTALPHSAVDQYILISNLKIVTAPRHLMIRSDKLQFHVHLHALAFPRSQILMALLPVQPPTDVKEPAHAPKKCMRISSRIIRCAG